MLRRINSCSICFTFGLSVLLVLSGSTYTESRKSTRISLKIDNNVNKILEKARAQIITELSRYNFSYSGVDQLKDLVMETGGNPLRSVIISTWRSGSSFLGELLNAVPGNFYCYEPLLNYEGVQFRGPPQSEKAIRIIKSMLECNYNNMKDYFEFARTHQFQQTFNTRLWDHCKHRKELCFDAEFTSRFCKLFPFQSMKVVRLRLQLIEELLHNGLNIQVVLLIRDPRGVMRSRQHVNFCRPYPDCWRPDLLCADMISDYVAAARLLESHPNRLMVLRFEELALHPQSVTQKLLKFLRISKDISAMPAVDKFLYSHTNYAGGILSTFRVSRDVPFRWKDNLEFSNVDTIQLACKKAMRLWGYKMALNATHMQSNDFDPLETYSIRLRPHLHGTAPYRNLSSNYYFM